MARLKTIGVEVARYIYWEKKTDEQVIAILREKYQWTPEGAKEVVSEVRGNPKTWRDMAGAA